MRILLLEDDPELANAIQASLGRHGMVVDVVVSMAQAAEALKTCVHQILLLDRQLPDGDGANFVRVARSHVPNLPVIMLTARDSVADRVVGLDVGADDYLTKPFSPRELVARVQAMLRRPRTGNAAEPEPPEPLTFGELTIDLARHTVHKRGEPVE